MAKQTFTIGQVLEAADMTALQANDYNWTVDTKTDNYVLVAGDAGKRIVMNAATAKTITVNTSVFTAGDTVWIHNINTGTCTVTAGTATVNTAGSLALAQWEGGALYFTSASSAIFFRGGGTSVLSIDYLLVGAGGGGGSAAGNSGGGGGGGGFRTATDLIAKGNTYTVTVGAGGSGGVPGTSQYGRNGTASSFIRSANGGGSGSVTAGAAGDASAAASPNSAPANRGGGGGGARDATTAGNGGSGRVVLRILTADLNKFTVTTTGSPTTGTYSTYTYYDYTATGTFRID
jgi:hypothetical protein